MLSNRERMNRIRFWQKVAFFHPLTCGNDSRHRELEPREVDGKIELFCLDCDYVQKSFPMVSDELFPKTPAELEDLCQRTMRAYPESELLRRFELDYLIKNSA